MGSLQAENESNQELDDSGYGQEGEVFFCDHVIKQSNLFFQVKEP